MPPMGKPPMPPMPGKPPMPPIATAHREAAHAAHREAAHAAHGKATHAAHREAAHPSERAHAGESAHPAEHPAEAAQPAERVPGNLACAGNAVSAAAPAAHGVEARIAEVGASTTRQPRCEAGVSEPAATALSPRVEADVGARPPSVAAATAGRATGATGATGHGLADRALDPGYDRTGCRAADRTEDQVHHAEALDAPGLHEPGDRAVARRPLQVGHRAAWLSLPPVRCVARRCLVASHRLTASVWDVVGGAVPLHRSGVRGRPRGRCALGAG